MLLQCYSNVNPPTASPAPCTSLSSSSPLLPIYRGTGLKIGLAKIMDDLRVGLEVMLTGRGKDGYEPPIVGEEVVELTADPGIFTGIEMGRRAFRPVIGAPTPLCASLKCDMEGDTARRLEADGYGSKRSSSFRLFERTALVVGGGVYLQ